jgi:hypothetical protein
VWAVGDHLGLVLHWDGTRWRVAWWNRSWITHGQGLSGVVAVSPLDVWVVGSESGSRSLAMHWDGVRWRTVPAPGIGLSGVAALSSRDVWAVGWADHGGLIAHWDGVRWRVVYEPGEKVACCLAIAALSPHDVWVTGVLLAPVTVALHWDGHHWRSVPLPAAKNGALLAPGAGLSGGALAAISAQDVWMVGAMGNTPQAVVSAQDVWTVGALGNTPQTAQSKTLTEHWDGVRWRLVPSPNVAGRDNMLLSVAAVSARDVWAVGASRQYKAGRSQTLIEHWDGVRWSIVPS